MSQTTWQFYTQTSSAWEAMIFELLSAKNSISIEQFVFLDDRIGRQFIEALKNRARAGVKIRILVDYVGSFNFVNSKIYQELRVLGVEILYHNKVKPWLLRAPISWFWRDHRKIMIIDERVFYTGGVGIEEVMRTWRDTEVRFEGEIVLEASYVFNRMWQMVSEGRFRRFRLDRRPELPFRFLTNSPHFRQRFYYRRLLRSVKRAKKFIYLTTPYFIPNSRFLLSLIAAARRGVDVRLITPERSDHTLVDDARNSYYTILLKAGVRIFHYQHQVMHAKAGVIDGTWSTVGSANLDNLSLLLNYEANVVTHDRAFANALKKQFEDDLKNCQELVPEDWYQRPLMNKIRELLTWPFHGLM